MESEPRATTMKVLLHLGILHATCLAMFLLLWALRKVELDSTLQTILATILSTLSASASSVTAPCNLSYNALLNQPIRILIILSSVLLGRSFVSCWQSDCTVLWRIQGGLCWTPLWLTHWYEKYRSERLLLLKSTPLHRILDPPQELLLFSILILKLINNSRS